MQNRKNVTWRIGDDTQHELLNNWLDNQNNIQTSLANVALHMIDRFGYRNIMDYDIQKALHQEFPRGNITNYHQQTKEVSADNTPMDSKEKQLETSSNSFNNEYLYIRKS